jgi:two-component system, cell cycle response regulator
MSARPRLLLVEDEPTQQMTMERLLTNAGYDVEIVGDGEQALAKVKSAQFDLLLTDWELPGMDGATLCRLVREAQLPSIYILLLTSHSAVARAVEGLRAGANDFIRKPADEAELLARLDAGHRVVQLEKSLRDANTQIERLSVTDPLLGIFNRRYLHTGLREEIARARRYQRPLAIAIADLDHFKVINDSYGHQTGDAVLQHVVCLTQSALRQKTDWIARYGGEEFVIVLPETDAHDAVAVAQRIRNLCMATPALLPAGRIFVTASFGVAGLDAGGVSDDDGDALLQEADRALYQSKDSGRNQVTCRVWPPRQALPNSGRSV